jgi:hypothetical protein
MVKNIKNTMQQRRKPIKGICAAARALGRNRRHLWGVITGERKSPGLLARYQKWAATNGDKNPPQK